METETERTCKSCKRTKPIDEFKQFKKRLRSGARMYRQQICKKCRYEKHVKPWRDRSGWHGKHRDWVNRNSRRLKKEALDHYGGKCSCCGESEEAFLCLDHVNGGGNEHRKELKQKYRTIWEWLKAEDYPGGFQVLCANCNMAKSLLGACPHKLSMTG